MNLGDLVIYRRQEGDLSYGMILDYDNKSDQFLVYWSEDRKKLWESSTEIKVVSK